MNKEMKIFMHSEDMAFVAGIAVESLGKYLPRITRRSVSPGVIAYTFSFELSEEVAQDDWKAELSPSFLPDFHWAPHLTPTDGHIVDQHSFRSPALIATDANRGIVLIPDLDILSGEVPVRWYLDMDATNNKLVLGMSNYSVKEHVLYTRAKGARYPAGKLEIGFYLLLLQEEESLWNPWRTALQFLWENWGGKLYRQGEPVGVPLMRYVDHAYRWAFEKWGDVVWQEFELEGETVGATVFIVNVTQSPGYGGPAEEREFRSIWNQAWFSSLRTAHGMYRYGELTGNPVLKDRARMVKELALAAPVNKGFFPAVIATEMETLEAGGRKLNRSRGWKHYYWGNSNRNPFTKDPRLSPYHVADMSYTALLMLRWHEELEQDGRLVEYAWAYGDSLVKLQSGRGFFPAWLDRETLMPMGVLEDSPESSLSVTFLLKLYETSGDGKYLRAALKAMEAICGEIIPEGRWEDFETYWSCCTYGQEELPGKKVKRNNMYKQCNLSMFWTAEALWCCYKATGEERYLKYGQRCLDEMLMTQASWQPPYLFVNVLGGFGVMNCDGEWNDARQSLFAGLVLRYGRELGREEYIERGMAAMKASFALMYCPENKKAREQWESKWPFFSSADYGFMMENYGHEGAAEDSGVGMGEFTIFDWGAGGACESYLRILQDFRELAGEHGIL